MQQPITTHRRPQAPTDLADPRHKPGDSWRPKNPPQLSPDFDPSPQPTDPEQLKTHQNNARGRREIAVSTVTHWPLAPSPGPAAANKNLTTAH